MGLYQTALGAALAAGPFIPALLQWQAQTTLMVAALVQLAALVLALRTGIAFVGGVFEAGLSSISAANGAALGLSMAAAASIVGVLGMGSFLFQYPAGLAADLWLQVLRR